MQASLNQEHRPFAKLLAHHYGDGCVYLPKSMNSGVLQDAKRQGFVSEDGFLTRKGRNFLAGASS